MKRILCVAALAGLTTALHAVTYEWNSAAGAFKTQDGKGTLTSYNVAAAQNPRFTKLEFSFMYQIASSDVTKTSFGIQQTGEGGVKSDFVRMNVESTASAGTNRATYIINGATYTGSDGWTAERAQKDMWVSSVFTFSDLEDGVFKTMKVQNGFFTSPLPVAYVDTFTGSFDFRGTSFDYFDYASLTVAVPMTVGFVPEPGVVTLLALGVAGLALRRKVA